jgi:hypothetical protein
MSLFPAKSQNRVLGDLKRATPNQGEKAMNDIAEITEDQEIEMHEECDSSDGSEITDVIGDDESTTAYDDHLSESILSRIKSYVPAHTQFASKSGNGYIECYTEQAERLNDDASALKVGVTLIEENLEEKANELRGVLNQQFIAGDSSLELSYRYIEAADESGFFYSITLNGRYVKGFKRLALAHLAFDILVDHKSESFQQILEDVTGVFNAYAVRYEQKMDEECSESFKNFVIDHMMGYLG